MTDYKFTDLFGGYDALINIKYNVKDPDQIDKNRIELYNLYNSSMNKISHKEGWNFNRYPLPKLGIALYAFLYKLFVPEVGNAKTNFGEILRLIRNLYSSIKYFMDGGTCKTVEDLHNTYSSIKDGFINLDWIIKHCMHSPCIDYNEVFDIFSFNKCKHFNILKDSSYLTTLTEDIFSNDNGFSIRIDKSYLDIVNELNLSILSTLFTDTNPIFKYLSYSYKASAIYTLDNQLMVLARYDEDYTQ